MNSVILEKKENIAKVVINRPEVLNALDGPTIEELEKKLSELGKDENVRSVILTGSGRAFCVGADLKYIKSFEKFPYGDFLRKYFNRLILRIITLPKPVIASINGIVAGAGIGIALACDYKIASEKANFVEAFLNVALIPDSASCFLFLNKAGLTKALEFFTLGDTIDAKKALELGLINKVVEDSELDKETMNIALRYASLPTKAIALTKKLIYYSLSNDIERVLEYEAYLQEIAGSSEDHEEGLKAFLEKRKPSFKGK